MTESYGMATKYRFDPDYVVSPGETLRETLEAKGLSQADLAERTGMAEKTISQIANGIAPISYETAEKFELVTGVSASFWNRRELTYRERLVRREELLKLAGDTEWLSEIPVDALIERGFFERTFDKAHMVRHALKFFGVSSVESWRTTWAQPSVQYRGKKAHEKHPGFVAAWLRMGDLKAEEIECQPFNAREFRRILNDLRALTTTAASQWRTELPDLCATAGVCVVLTKEIPRASLSGAARWITKNKALIQLSLKYKTDDQFWFSFFHECGHVLLHGKRQIFVDYGMRDDTEEEREANKFARDILVPPEYEQSLPLLKSKKDIKRFAASIGVSAGIVVGRLQRDKFLRPNYCNDLKVKYPWA